MELSARVTQPVAQPLGSQAELAILLLDAGHALEHHFIILSRQNGLQSEGLLEQAKEYSRVATVPPDNKDEKSRSCAVELIPPSWSKSKQSEPKRSQEESGVSEQVVQCKPSAYGEIYHLIVHCAALQR
ncbi:hypothetical protein EYF80_002435 [Liparis tanakae]|uniref:Uncharacterized protein n=1 Tax=Liparis tanakae TaxID=230148 RepID=A0A4Z2JBV2_9TELE|nr:hypothetical protein EYF80_002435 [Liparis tanakae]